MIRPFALAFAAVTVSACSGHLGEYDTAIATPSTVAVLGTAVERELAGPASTEPVSGLDESEATTRTSTSTTALTGDEPASTTTSSTTVEPTTAPPSDSGPSTTVVAGAAPSTGSFNTSVGFAGWSLGGDGITATAWPAGCSSNGAHEPNFTYALTMLGRGATAAVQLFETNGTAVANRWSELARCDAYSDAVGGVESNPVAVAPLSSTTFYYRGIDRGAAWETIAVVAVDDKERAVVVEGTEVGEEELIDMALGLLGVYD